MNKVKMSILVLLVGALTGCALPVTHMGTALFISTSEPVVATTVEQANKKGEACANNILGLVAFGDASIAQAKNNGNIVKVSTVDVNTVSVLGLFSKRCTIVNGN